jgi:hypothetical protein
MPTTAARQVNEPARAGVKLTVMQAVACFAEWVIAGIVISLIYRAAH